ncbi:hypothetical protein ACIRQP_35025 [Streptomyces sp. NPDC102274]|uniref:hypothetical protein n=1 Tax=Streptomyces sp. NPDC102274 TaxID=3366151 RepID=UPI003829851F
MTSAQIILLLSRADDSIVALPRGTGRPWAETALDLAGFTRQYGGIRTLPLTDTAAAREALAHLTQTARDCQTQITTSNRAYLGDVASAISGSLPGAWKVTTENFTMPDVQQGLVSWLWGSENKLATAITQYGVPYGAVLSDQRGAEFLLIERPGAEGWYLLGALVPDADYIDLPVPAPCTIAAPTLQTASVAMRTVLLPAYEQAVRLVHLHEAEEDLAWVQETFEPGTVIEPYPFHLAAKLEQFLKRAPGFISAIRHPDAPVLAPPQAAFLDSFEDALNAARSGPDQALRSSPNTMALWLDNGAQLIELARAIRAPIGPSAPSAPARPGVRTAAPPPPPAADTAATHRR